MQFEPREQFEQRQKKLEQIQALGLKAYPHEFRWTDTVADLAAKFSATPAAELEAEDDLMDQLHRQLFRELLSDEWPHGIESAIDVTLLGRYYERFADHAVAIARQVSFLVTGQPHER